MTCAGAGAGERRDRWKCWLKGQSAPVESAACAVDAPRSLLKRVGPVFRVSPPAGWNFVLPGDLEWEEEEEEEGLVVFSFHLSSTMTSPAALGPLHWKAKGVFTLSDILSWACLTDVWKNTDTMHPCKANTRTSKQHQQARVEKRTAGGPYPHRL